MRARPGHDVVKRGAGSAAPSIENKDQLMSDIAMLNDRNADWVDAIKDVLCERYGPADTPDFIADADILNLLSHRSVRAYSDKILPDHALETMIAAAQSASSSSNLQTWSAVAVTERAKKETLARLANNQQHIIDAPLQIVWLADHSRLRAAAAKRGIEAKGLDYLELFVVGCIDAALAAQNAAVAAEALGLGIVYIGGMRNNPQEVARTLGLPTGVFAVFGMCVGYPDETRPAQIKPRLPQEAVLFRETYSVEAASRPIDDYDALMERFYSGQRMRRDRWSVHSGRRVSGPETLSGRDKLKAIVRKMGFLLE